jgi:hypothetical protein
MSLWKRLVARFLVAILFFVPCMASGATAIVSRPRFDDLLAAIDSSSNVQIACDGKITFAFPLNISTNLTIDATGHAVVFDMRGLDQFFILNSSGSLTLKSLTLTNGYTVGNGGAIVVNGGSLTLENCIFTHNNSVGTRSIATFVYPPVGVPYTTYTNPGASYGGAIWAATARINITSCVFELNVASAQDGASAGQPYGQANIPGTASGGAICANNSFLSISSSTFRANWSNAGRISGLGSNGATSKGGAICVTNCAVQLTGNTFVSNLATPSDATYEGGGALAAEGGSVTIDRSSFASNSIANHSGGAALLTGAVSPCIIARSIFMYNLATNEGGGAISHTAPMQIVQSTFISNRANGRDAYWFSAGGRTAIVLETQGSGGAILSNGRLDATNCIFYANIARSGDGIVPYSKSAPSYGAALYVKESGDVHLTHCTLGANVVELAVNPDTSVPIVGSAIAMTNSGSAFGKLELEATLLSGVSPIVRGSISDAGYNICSDGSAAFTKATSLNNTDPVLQFFAEQKFSVLRPAPTSPAVSRITSRLTDIDIRGALRGALPHDAGAVELDATTDLSVNTLLGAVMVTAPNYSDPLEIFGSDDLKTWTSIGASGFSGSTPALAVPPSGLHRFYRARLDQ